MQQTQAVQGSSTSFWFDDSDDKPEPSYLRYFENKDPGRNIYLGDFYEFPVGDVICEGVVFSENLHGSTVLMLCSEIGILKHNNLLKGFEGKHVQVIRGEKNILVRTVN